LADRLKSFLGLAHARVVGPPDHGVERVAVACGSGGSFLAAAREGGCECLVTGETNFHTCLEAEASGVALILTGHFASERFGVEWLADHLSAQLPDAEVWASRREADPLRTR
jgi:putative NIF3 family GTP cyclohydrolase 1 type 2